MLDWQMVIVALYGLGALFILVRGLHECYWNKKSYEEVLWERFYGAFALGDCVIFGIFWIIISLAVLFLNDWTLFLLILSVFWTIRSLGETNFWFGMQFAPMKRYPPKYFPIYRFFHDDSVYFIQQITWQCVATLAIISSLYFGVTWIRQF